MTKNVSNNDKTHTEAVVPYPEHAALQVLRGGVFHTNHTCAQSERRVDDVPGSEPERRAVVHPVFMGHVRGTLLLAALFSPLLGRHVARGGGDSRPPRANSNVVAIWALFPS